jgi:ABC-type lipopolysaccharide export system ATPase subunit
MGPNQLEMGTALFLEIPTLTAGRLRPILAAATKYVIDHGTIVFEGTPDALRANTKVTTTYLGVGG